MFDAFIPVATLTDLPSGRTQRVLVGGHPILLANVDGHVYAVDDTCTHEDSSLSLGCLKGELVSCTLHGSRFSVRTGQPVEEPAQEALMTYPVRIQGDTILVHAGAHDRE
jgi:3-phenylpropionate/trans-cinnamate dioxygenase ferredoxin subunit